MLYTTHTLISLQTPLPHTVVHPSKKCEALRWVLVGMSIMRQYQFHTLLEFIDSVTLPEHCQIYPLSFDRMKGIKHLVFMIGKCFSFW